MMPWIIYRYNSVTKHDLQQMEKRIMNEIKDFAAVVQTIFDQLAASVDGLVADISNLKAKINELQTSTGAITADDQALLDAIEAQALKIGVSVKALDEATENPLPVPAV